MDEDLQDLRERIVRLETKHTAMIEKQAEMVAKLDEKATASDQKVIKTKVDEMHELLLQAKGARWAALALVTLLASFFGYVIHAAQAFLTPPHAPH